MSHGNIYVSSTSFRTLSHEAIADVWELFDYSDGDGNATRMLLSVTQYRMLTLSGFGLCQKKLTWARRDGFVTSEDDEIWPISLFKTSREIIRLAVIL